MNAKQEQIFDPLTHTSLKDGVLRLLRNAILSGDLKPGQRLMQTALAEQFGVSRGPVREALAALEAEALVISSPNRSPRVANIKAEDFEELVEVRWLLETFAIKKALNKIREEDLEFLDDLVAKMNAALIREDEVDFVDADVRFHEKIVLMAGNDKLHQLWLQLKGHIRLLITLMIEIGLNPENMNLLHGEVVKALRRGDRQYALDTVNAHNRDASREIMSMIKSLSEKVSKDE